MTGAKDAGSDAWGGDCTDSVTAPSKHSTKCDADPHPTHARFAHLPQVRSPARAASAQNVGQWWMNTASGGRARRR
ncbi:hypothetical protein GCM10027068_24790 [Prescottella soli]